MIKVGVDIQVLQSQERSGFGYYVDGLYQSLLKVAAEEKVEIVGLESRWSEGLATHKRFLHDRFEVAQIANKQGVDLIHQPCFSAPKSNKKTIWTLHDLRQIILDEPMSVPAAMYWKKYLPYSARYADTIVATTESTRNDAVKYLGLQKQQIKVITIGLPHALLGWKPSDDMATSLKQKFGLTGQFLTSLGTIQPIKNYPFLIDVFVALRREHKLKHQLVIIGGKGWDYVNVQKKLQEHRLEEGKDVVITGYATDDEKWQLLHSSEAFLFPSLYEGFGIPPIEAQALGTPVLSSDNSSLPWVLGNSAVLCSATDVASWVRGYDRMINDRTDLIKAGKDNVKRFNWDDIAREWCALYRSLAR